jgi:hypothetical protein
VAISRRIEDKWRLIGWGHVLSGTVIDLNWNNCYNFIN